MNKKEHYKNLYKKYKDLVAKTSIKTYEIISGGKISAQNISPKDLKERQKVEEELSGGLEFLSDDQLIDLSKDVPFSEKVTEALKKRREVQ
ncbi:MAG: hypothetical protein HYS78_02450 [Parcubacteria group bacterium]|nr:hypothetical protein [Parcubacteria group bacterium]